MRRFERLADKASELGIIYLVIGLPVIFFTRTADVFEMNKMFTLRFFTIAITALWVIRSILKRKMVLGKSDFDIAMVLFLGAALINTLFTNNSAVSVFGVYEDYEGILTVLNYFILFYIIITYSNSREKIFKIAIAAAAASFIVSVYGFLQNFGIDFVRWNPETYNPGRFFSTLGNPNFLAAYLVEIIPVLFMLFFIARRIPKKTAVLVVMIMSIVVLFLTKSRAGFISFMITLVLIMFYTLYDSAKKEAELYGKNRIWIFMFVLIFAATLIFSSRVQDAFVNLNERIALIFRDGIMNVPRMYIWLAALEMFRDNPVLGKGLDTFQVMFPYYRMPEYWRIEWNGTPEKTHNVFLQVLSTQGMVGFSAYVLLITVFIKKTMKSVFYGSDPLKRYMVFAFFMSAAAFFIQGMFNYTVVAYGSFFWIAIACISVMDGKKDKVRYIYASKKMNSFLGKNMFPAAAVVFAAAVILAVNLTHYWAADMYFKIGNIGVRHNKETFALPYYEKAVMLNKYREIYQVKYGIAYERAVRSAEDAGQKKHFLEKALETHKGTLEINDKNGYNYNNIARTYKLYGDTMDPGMYKNAIKYYKEAAKRDPNNAYFGLDLASVHINMGNFDAAEEICVHFAELYPDFAVSFSYIGYIYMLRWKQTLESEPEKAKEYLRRSRDYYKQAIEGKQWFGDEASMLSTYSNLGIISFNLGETEKAVSYFEKIKAKRPRYKEVYLNMAMLYMRMNMIDKAIEEYRAVLRIDPNDRRASGPLEELLKRR